MDSEKSIEFQHVSFRLPDGRTLLSDLTLEVHRGETLVLLGRSGSGKTTTMKLINRLIDPTEGQVKVDGKPTLEWDPIQLRRRIGYVIQEVGLFPHLSVEENIGVVPRLEGWEAERIKARARELLATVGLDPEPFGALDPITRRDIQQEFRTLQERLQKTLVFVTHDVREALLLAHRIGLVKDGKMVLLGPPSDLLQSKDPEARAFAACVSDGELSGSPV